MKPAEQHHVAGPEQEAGSWVPWALVRTPLPPTWDHLLLQLAGWSVGAAGVHKGKFSHRTRRRPGRDTPPRKPQGREAGRHAQACGRAPEGCALQGDRVTGRSQPRLRLPPRPTGRGGEDQEEETSRRRRRPRTRENRRGLRKRRRVPVTHFLPAGRHGIRARAGTCRRRESAARGTGPAGPGPGPGQEQGVREARHVTGRCGPRGLGR